MTPRLSPGWMSRKTLISPFRTFPLVYSEPDILSAVAGVAIGNSVLDLVYLHENGFFAGIDLPQGVFNQPYLNDFFALGKEEGS